MNQIELETRVKKATADFLQQAIRFVREKKKNSYAGTSDLTTACEAMEAAMLDAALGRLGIDTVPEKFGEDRELSRGPDVM